MAARAGRPGRRGRVSGGAGWLSGEAGGRSFAGEVQVDPAILDFDDPVGLFGNFSVVGDNDECRMISVIDLAQGFVNDFSRLRIQVTGRFVCQDELGIHDQGPGYRRPLLLAAGHVVGQVVLDPGQADQFHQLVSPVQDFPGGAIVFDQVRHQDIFQGGKLRQ